MGNAEAGKGCQLVERKCFHVADRKMRSKRSMNTEGERKITRRESSEKRQVRPALHLSFIVGITTSHSK